MKSQRFQFYNKGQIAALTAENPAQSVVPDWYTYRVTASVSDAFPGWCAITIMPSRNTPAELVQNKLVKGDEAAGLAWAEKHLREEVHSGYHMDKTAPKDL